MLEGSALPLCLSIKSKCVKGEGFLISYFISSCRRRRYFQDAAREDVNLAGVREEDAEVKARTEADDCLWLNLGLGGVAQKRKCLSSSHRKCVKSFQEETPSAGAN